MSDDAEVWRRVLLDAAQRVERAITQPPARDKGETLLAYVNRTRRAVDEPLKLWRLANTAMHEALKPGP